MIVAKDDHNDALFTSKSLFNLHRKIGYRFPTRIVEAASVKEATELAAQLAGRFGGASYCILRGHGSERSFALGKESGRDVGSGAKLYHPDSAKGGNLQVSEESSFEHFSASLRNILRPGAGVVFSSCSTGAGENSIAAEMAKQTGHQTVAPDDIFFGEGDWEPQVQGEAVTFDVTYSGASAKVNR